jgi:chromosome segregation ATPase
MKRQSTAAESLKRRTRAAEDQARQAEAQARINERSLRTAERRLKVAQDNLALSVDRENTLKAERDDLRPRLQRFEDAKGPRRSHPEVAKAIGVGNGTVSRIKAGKAA